MMGLKLSVMAGIENVWAVWHIINGIRVCRHVKNLAFVWESRARVSVFKNDNGSNKGVMSP